MSQLAPGQVDPEGWAIHHEVLDVQSLLDWTTQTLSQPHPAYHPPLLAVASSAAEHYLKLTLSLVRRHREGHWPNVREYGHDIVKLHLRARDVIAETIDLSPIVASAGAAVDADPWIQTWLRILTIYASQGRYENLDRLRKPDLQQGPRNLTATLDDDLSAGYDFGRVPFVQEDLDAYIRGQLGRSWARWRGLYAAAWTQGTFGPHAASYSGALTRGPRTERPRPQGGAPR